jgi:hypothetical protein
VFTAAGSGPVSVFRAFVTWNITFHRS